MCVLFMFGKLINLKPNIMKNVFYLLAVLFTSLYVTSCTNEEAIKEEEFEIINEVDRGKIERPGDQHLD